MAFVFRLVFRMEEPSLTARRAIFTGYLFHGLYILVELGDGEFLDHSEYMVLPIPIRNPDHNGINPMLGPPLVLFCPLLQRGVGGI